MASSIFASLSPTLVAPNIGAATGTSLALTGVLNLGAFTVATLPAGSVGDRAYVTNALTPVVLSAVVAGGAVVVPVFKNATAWIVG